MTHFSKYPAQKLRIPPHLRRKVQTAFLIYTSLLEFGEFGILIYTFAPRRVAFFTSSFYVLFIGLIDGMIGPGAGNILLTFAAYFFLVQFLKFPAALEQRSAFNSERFTAGFF